MNFEESLQNSPKILMECAIAERVRRSHPDLMHPRLATSLLIQTAEGREILRSFVRAYITIAKEATLPIVVGTPTWRLDQLRCAEEHISENLNAKAVQFEQEFYADYSNLFIAGQLGCKNDCYKPEEALSPSEAYDFHAWQIERLTDADFLYAVTLPEVREALGIAQAMAQTGRPYIISFCIGKNGCVLDGTTLEDAIDRIDAESKRPPTGYGVNCCYPSFLQASDLSEGAAQRMVSMQANASSLTHDELDASESLQTDPIYDWKTRMLDLHQTRGIKMLGGCCGTADAHLKALV